MRIAITGGICDGKTTILGFLRELGFSTVSADEVVRELYLQPKFQAALAERFGPEALDGNRVNRDFLRNAITQHASARRFVNSLVHKSAMERILQMTEADGPAFAEVPLLIETAMQGFFDRVWVASAGYETQLSRLIERCGAEAPARSLLATQLPTEAKEPFASAIIRTNRPEEVVKKDVVDLANGLH